MKHFLEGLRLYAVFRGRATRRQFWWYRLFYIVTILLLCAPLIIAHAISGPGKSPSAGVIDALILLPVAGVIAMAVPSFAIAIRRLHDIGASGWTYLVILIPYVGGLLLLFGYLSPSEPLDNRWGPNPMPDTGQNDRTRHRSEQVNEP